MKVALIGYDVEGKSSYEYYKSLGHDITICDQNQDLLVPTGVPTVLGPTYLDDLDRFDIIVRTAGIPLDKVLSKNPTITEKITTQTSEFLRVCTTKHLIGVTGTKGKGTTATLITNILQAAGHDTYLGGNIGVAPFSFLSNLTSDSWVVLELSSFQLLDVKYSPHIGVCLMVVPEHLNWHRDMEDYMQAKSQLFRWQTSEDIAIYFAESATSHEIAQAGAGKKIPFYASPGAFVNGNMITIDGTEICTTDELRLLGRHNWQNVCAAITAVWQAGIQDIVAIRTVVTSFTGLKHRLEFVRELNGVRYFDDSFGTTPETSIVAQQAFPNPKILILGGSDKGAQYDELARAVATNNVRKALLIGSEAPMIQLSLENAGFTDFMPGGGTMTDIIQTAQSEALPGDVVLLSTGCASFGMFKNYKDRGDQFKSEVHRLT